MRLAARRRVPPRTNPNSSSPPLTWCARSPRLWLQTVQQQLSDAEKVDKQDDSPVTVADYGAQVVVAWALSRAEPSVKLSMVAEEDSASLRRAPCDAAPAAFMPGFCRKYGVQGVAGGPGRS
jgi:hypothetical protein